MKYCITNGKVILKNQVVDANVYVENTKITEISNRQPDDETVIDAKGRYVSPGFIDVHTHGPVSYTHLDVYKRQGLLIVQKN